MSDDGRAVRGYVGIGVVNPKSRQNVGGLWRSAHAFGADFIFTVGKRYERQPTDTTKAARHLPLYEYDSVEQLAALLPVGAKLVGVECGVSHPVPWLLPQFRHPERAVYLLGAEDTGLPVEALERCDGLVEIPGEYCLNVATAGSILLYDRVAKGMAARSRQPRPRVAVA